MTDETKSRIAELVRQHCEANIYEFVPGKTTIPLVVPAFDYGEIMEAIDSLLAKNVTMGKKVKEFERLFSEYLGAKNSVMVNSGSSANLVALSILSNKLTKGRVLPGDEIITPAVTWATTIYPIENINAVSVLVDVDVETFNIDIESARKAITPKTKAIMPVHLLGNPCDIKAIMEIAEENDLFVIEDSCEAHGAEVGGKKVGTFGDMGTFSFFLSHHITTVEGGMVVTNNDDYYEMAKAMRAFGWIRDQTDKEMIAQKHSSIDNRFLFTNLGFNLRPMEVQGAFGIHQLPKLDKFIEIRRGNAAYWNKRFDEYSNYIMTQNERRGTRHVWFSYPITIREGAPFTVKDMVSYLRDKKIETRPIMAGNIKEQPVIDLINHRVSGGLKNSRTIMRNSFFFGNHQNIGPAEREYVADCVTEFIESKTN